MKEIVIYGKEDCPACKQAKMLAENKGLQVEYLVFPHDFGAKQMAELFPTARSFPQCILDGEKIGGYASLVELLTNER
tara:strand:+ start:84 stop:317 length:234 start_codon:yes stop_codon:yes gene_type:complete